MTGAGFEAGLVSSLVRVYPRSAISRAAIELRAARGEAVSFQVAVRTADRDGELTVEVDAADGLSVSVRRVGYVPLRHHQTGTEASELDGLGHIPGLAPDPLLPGNQVLAGPHETNAFWVRVGVEVDSPAGRRPIRIRCSAFGDTVELEAVVVVHPVVVPARSAFRATHWFYADALFDHYRLEPWSDGFWRILPAYLENMVGHGLDAVTVPMLTPPTDGVKRPTQLLHVSRGPAGYDFDWDLVHRWMDASSAAGFTHFDWNHLFSQWGVEHAVRVYEGHGKDRRLMWPEETPATAPAYREFLGALLPELREFLDRRGALDNSTFHLSDEPFGEAARANYRAARNVLRELAPWMEVTDALSEVAYAREGLCDHPVASISHAPEFAAEGYGCQVYFCNGPRGAYLNRLMDTPLQKVRMSGWLFHRNRAEGFLHWGYNYWYRHCTQELVNPFEVNDGHLWPVLPSGDTFVVYPGEGGPIDSTRWEVFGESMQDLALLQASGVSPDDERLAAIRDYAVFPRDEAWLTVNRRDVLESLAPLGASADAAA